MMRVLPVALILGAFLLASCKGGANNVVLASLDRSEKIQLLCADIELLTGNLYDLRQMLPLELCDSETVFAPSVLPQALGAVTQTQTGTVAAISFTRNAILDTNRTIPGVTAFGVDEQPTGIQISPTESSYTYVSNFSGESVQAIPTEAVLTGASTLPEQRKHLGGAPTDLALFESARSNVTLDDELRVTGAKSFILYRYLYAAIPELGGLAEIGIETTPPDQGENGILHVAMEDPVPLPLGTYDCDSVTAVQSPESDASDYHRICPEDFQDRPGRFIKTVATTETCSDGVGTGPSPVALTVDYGLKSDNNDDVLLVADSNQPVIHRFSLSAGGATPLDPIVIGTPTSDLDVTPFVPASSDLNDRAATQRYIYAVSALDSSIIAIDYTPGSPSFGAVIPVLAGISARANEENVESRSQLRSAFSNARAIEVVSPNYSLSESGGGASVPESIICDPSDPDAYALAQNESNMRGVFLAVSLSNGRIFFLDVYDLNAPCRGGEGAIACTLAETGPDQFASIRRHRRRFGFTPSTYITIDGTPSIQFNAAPGQLDELTGEPTNSDGPGLEFIDCPPSMSDPDRSSMLNLFGVPDSGDDSDGLICASSQVWSSLTQRWDARWAGLIPHSEGGLGLFSDETFDGVSGPWFVAGDVPLCRVGVLGPQSGTPSDTGLSIDQLDAYGGDRLVITGELPPNTEDDPNCEDFKDLLDDIDDRQIWFPIERAFNDRLKIGPSPNPTRYTLDEVRSCFNQYTGYQIHTQDVYTVTGTTTGFVHRVIPDPTTGECIFDDTRPVVALDVDTYLTSRAFEGAQFINPLVSFQIEPFTPIVSITDSTVALLNFNILNQFTVEQLDTGGVRLSLPGSMLFSPDQDQIYFVDYVAGVQRITLSPLSIAQTFE